MFDVVMVRGHGARELLRIGGKMPGPGASLRFNVPQSTLMECRDGEGCCCDPCGRGSLLAVALAAPGM